MTVGDALVLMLSANTDGLARGLQDAQRMVDGASRTLARSLMEPLKSAFGFLATGLSLGALTQQYLREADAIGKQAEAIGVDIEELQHWSNAAALAGGSAEGFQRSLQVLNRNMQMAAQGQGEASKAFAQFGVKIKDGSGKTRDALDVMRDLAGAFETMDKQKALAMGQKIGLDRGTILLLQSGKAKLEDLLKAQRELGAYTKEDEEIAHKTNVEIAKLKQTLKMVAAEVLRHVVPALSWLGDKLNKGIAFLRRHKPFVLAFIAGAAALITAKMIPALKKMALANAAAWAPFLLAAAIIGALALLFDDFWTYVNGGDSALEDLWKTFGEGPELLAKVNKGWKEFKETSSQAWDNAKAKAEEFFKNFDTEGMTTDAITSIDGIATIVQGLFNFDFATIGKGIGETFSGAFGIVEKSFTGLIKFFSKGGDGELSWAWLNTSFDKALKGMGSLWDGFLSGLSPEAREDINTLWEGISGGWEELKRDIDEWIPDFSEWKKKLDEFFDEVKKMLIQKFPKLAKFFGFMDEMDEQKKKMKTFLKENETTDFEEKADNAAQELTDKLNPDNTKYQDKAGQEQRRIDRKNERENWHKTQGAPSAFAENEKKEEQGFFARLRTSFDEVLNGIASDTAGEQDAQSAPEIRAEEKRETGEITLSGKKDEEEGIFSRAISSFNDVLKNVTKDAFGEPAEQPATNNAPEEKRNAKEIAFSGKETKEEGLLSRMIGSLNDVLNGIAKDTALDFVPATAMATTQNVDQSMTVNDYKRVQITVEAAANPEATGQAVQREMEKQSNYARQAAFGVQSGGGGV